MTSISIFDITASGLSAERTRMEVIANNIANANATRDANGEPYRRQQVVFSTAYEQAISAGKQDVAGVEVAGIQPDSSEFLQVYEPGHPDADENGFLMLPNVHLSKELVDLVTASRGYEANLKVMRSFQSMANSALELLRRI